MVHGSSLTAHDSIMGVECIQTQAYIESERINFSLDSFLRERVDSIFDLLCGDFEGSFAWLPVE